MTAYGTAAQLMLRINKKSNADDAVLTALLQAATNAIDRTTNHEIQGIDVFYPSAVASARKYVGSGMPYQWVDEFLSVSSVEIKESLTDTIYTALSATDYTTFTGGVRFPDFNTLPKTALLMTPNGNYRVFTLGKGSVRDNFPTNMSQDTSDLDSDIVITDTVRVTAVWGVTATPPQEIAEACYMLAARWWKRFESAMSDTLASGELGQLLYTQPIDPDVKFLLMNTRWYRPQVAPRF